MRLTVDGQRTEISTQRHCDPKKWNTRQGRLTGRSEEVVSLNDFLATMEYRIYDIDSLIATARSNKVATTLGIQDLSQLRKDYGKEQADVIMGIVGNIVSGQVTGDTAKQLSERIGKIMQDRQSLSINSNDTSISKSKQLEAAVPASKLHPSAAVSLLAWLPITRTIRFN